MPEERRSSRAPAGRRKAEWLTVLAAVTAAGAVLQFSNPPQSLLDRPAFGPSSAPSVPASASADAFGKSGGVNLRVALPSEAVEFPLEVDGDPSTLRYSWVRAGNDSLTEAPRPIGAKLVAPAMPGMYHLALVRGGERRVVDEVTVAVMVPFAQKIGTTLNGYRIGTYLAERIRGRADDAPEGFIEIGPEDLELAVTKHLRVADFLTHDGQSTWPRYVALDPKLLDKLELVIAEVKRLQGVTDTSSRVLSLDVHSGFRTPSHNRGVRRAARDSRHQYGDAADVVIDADFDGRYTAADSRLVALAVEMVEQDHPELKGGMGLYTSRRYRTPYVHIDARGRRARWRG